MTAGISTAHDVEHAKIALAKVETVPAFGTEEGHAPMRDRPELRPRAPAAPPTAGGRQLSRNGPARVHGSLAGT